MIVYEREVIVGKSIDVKHFTKWFNRQLRTSLLSSCRPGVNVADDSVIFCDNVWADAIDNYRKLADVSWDIWWIEVIIRVRWYIEQKRLVDEIWPRSENE